MIKNIILDIGKVLVAWEPEAAMRQLGMDDAAIAAVAGATVNTSLWDETDRGVWTDGEILNAAYRAAPAYKREIALFWNNVNLAVIQFPYTREWILSMKENGYKVYILSNYASWTYKRTRDGALDFLPLVDGALFSYTVKTIKPEEAIYRILLERYRLKPDECVFLDDRQINVDGAERLGIRSICFRDLAQAKRQLGQLGVFT